MTAAADKVGPKHVARKAVLYVRQSTQFQVQHHEEGRRLQYMMRDRLQALGWSDIEVIDEDLGRSGSTAAERTGFQRMVADVCLGRVGAVAAREVSRFARNNRDWHQLIEMCTLVDTLLVDHETVYDPRNGNDRLLLGLKGSLSEYELDLLRQRSLAARRQMASRGELLLQAPVGYVKAGERLEKDPDRRVQDTISLVFSKVEELGSVRQALLWFVEKDLHLPTRRREDVAGWTTTWRRATYQAIMRMLRNPAYAGAYAFGRSGVQSVVTDGAVRRTKVRLEREAWQVLIPDRHDPYVSWERFERIQHMIEGNVYDTKSDAQGAARRGPALLAGLLRCRRCGRKLTVAYSGRNRAIPRYSCTRGFLDIGDPKCISFGGLTVDVAIAGEVTRVVQPAAIDVARSVALDDGQARREVADALELELKQARYVADRAHRQYDHSDPENRLVADELERRWNAALVRVRELEGRLEQERRALPSSPPEAVELANLARDLANVWSTSQDVRLKKRILRSVIEEVVVDLDTSAAEVLLVIHWKGGVHSELRVGRRRKGQNGSHTSKDVVDAVRCLAQVCSDQSIAGYLNRNGKRTGKGNRWSRELVTSLRSKQRIPVFDPVRKDREGWLTLTEGADLVGVSPKTLRLAVERGVVPAAHPLPEGPWLLRRVDLEAPGTREALFTRNPAGLAPEQTELEFPST